MALTANSVSPPRTSPEHRLCALGSQQRQPRLTFPGHRRPKENKTPRVYAPMSATDTTTLRSATGDPAIADISSSSSNSLLFCQRIKTLTPPPPPRPPPPPAPPPRFKIFYYAFIYYIMSFLVRGAGIAQWLERRTRD